MFELNPAAGALGAEVSGLGSAQLDALAEAGPQSVKGAALRTALLSALQQYEVLFFRDLALTPRQHVALATLFGDLQQHEAYPHVEGYPQITVLENDRDNPSKIEKWHADMTFRARPPLGSILHGVIIPARGGDTLFASMSAAYEHLSDTFKARLEGLSAIHDFRHGFRESLAEPGGQERLAPMVAANPPVTHPLVRTHPESGKKAIFVNCLFTAGIVGMKPGESQALLDFLYEHVQQPEFSCRLAWEKNTVAFWDNRIVQHRPVNDYWPQHRRMQRITIDGDTPV